MLVQNQLNINDCLIKRVSCSSPFPPNLAECCVNADNMRVGPDELSEANCNGHVEVEPRQPRFRNEDQHNGNAESPEEHKESLVYPLCNGVDSTDFNGPDPECESRGARSREVTERCLPDELEDGELERRILQEEEDDETDCHYGIQEGLRNGQFIFFKMFNGF